MILSKKEWDIAAAPDTHPGYQGKRRTTQEQAWTDKYGEGNWRYCWQTADGTVLDFDQTFQVYVDGYEQYFRDHPDEAEQLIEQCAYGYDLDPISREEAFDPHALYSKSGVRNQFHHVAFNIAVEKVTGRPFQGTEPIQVREGKPGTPDDEQLKGFRWSPGRIPCVDPTIIPDTSLEGVQWWQDGSIEDFYQKAKTLQVRSET